MSVCMRPVKIGQYGSCYSQNGCSFLCLICPFGLPSVEKDHKKGYRRSKNDTKGYLVVKNMHLAKTVFRLIKQVIKRY